jgi:hypothetical protein
LNGGAGRRSVVNGGGIGSFLKKAVGGVARVAGAVLPGPAGALARVASTALSTSSSPAARMLTAPTVSYPSAPTFSARLSGGGGGVPVGAPAPGAGAMIQRILPGGGTGTGTGCTSGYHPNKTAYFLRSGEFVDVGTRCVRNRRRNPLNPRALDRSMARIASTGKALKSLGFRAPSSKKIAQTGRKPRRKKS